MSRVAIFGAGVGGLTTAHELIRRGFEVHLYEGTEFAGGKSRSHYPNLFPTEGNRSKMPGEHGFRFFPGFYRHIIDILEDIPGSAMSVAEKLVQTPDAGLAFQNEQLLKFPRKLDGGSYSIADMLASLTKLHTGLRFTTEDLTRMVWFRLKYLTSSPERRLQEYEKISWYDFVEGDSEKYSERFRKFDEAIPRTMSALVSRQTSAKVIGDIGMQFLLSLIRPWEPEDSLLHGPSSSVWIDVWVEFLEDLGVQIHYENRLTGINVEGDRIESCDVNGAELAEPYDQYVFALPINVMRDLVNDEMTALDPSYAHIRNTDSANYDGWMVGAQIYLAKDVPMVEGHMFYPDSPWAITSISQAQFWKQQGNTIENLYGDGSATGILSIIISDWDTEGTTGLSAKQLLHLGDRRAVVKEALRQIYIATQIPELNPDAQQSNAIEYYLDEGVFIDGNGAVVNSTPLLLHPVDGANTRPAAYSDGLLNCYLASDYVATYTQLASMESACEAAKRAVNKILERTPPPLGNHYPCDVVDLQEELIFRAAQELDSKRFLNGKEHIMDSFPFNLLINAPQLLSVATILLDDPPELLEAL